MSSKDYAVMPYSDYAGACDAIREKDGSSGQIKSGELRSKILAIESGADTSVVTATAPDVRSGKIIIDSNGNKVVGSMPNIEAVSQTLKPTATVYNIPLGYHDGTGKVSISVEEKTVSPTTSEQTVVPSTGKVLSEVNITAIQTEIKTATPQTESQTITPSSGKYLSKVTVNAMPTATQATPSISVDSSGKITASATQTAGYVAAGTKSATKQMTVQAAKTITPSGSEQTAVEAGVYTTGAVSVAAVPTQTKTATPTTASQTIKPDSGKFLSSVTVNAVPTQTKSATPTTASQTINPDSGKFLSQVTVDAIPSTYKKVLIGTATSSTSSSSPKYKQVISDSSITSSTKISFLIIHTYTDFVSQSHGDLIGYDVINGTVLDSMASGVQSEYATVTITSGRITISSDQPMFRSANKYVVVI